ncbi:unnamed protein product [Heligmosomoides polygyrus]|uniref:Uncharacterized protein n=1 Tax=Heligmosomoides polygyrus TaxID=6339 RepID=A0A3P7TBB3_HELPZ|nr:unnamed protein product [Heligmosomoides polygyrus]
MVIPDWQSFISVMAELYSSCSQYKGGEFAKDFFVFLHDRGELHCILLDRFAYNVECGKYVYDRQLVSERDFVWVYDLIPLLAALASPDAYLQSQGSHSLQLLFGVNFATDSCPLTRRGPFINNYKMAFEGAPEAVTVTQTLAQFSWKNDRNQLYRYVKLFLPANRDEAVVPLEAYELTPSESTWLADQLAYFESYRTSRAHSYTTTGATNPNLLDYPVRLEFLLSDMRPEAGYVRHRSTGVWITDASSFIRMEVDRVGSFEKPVNCGLLCRPICGPISQSCESPIKLALWPGNVIFD